MGLKELAGRIASGELTVDQGLHDMEERLRPPAPRQASDAVLADASTADRAVSGTAPASV